MATKKGLGRGLDILLPESDMPGGTTEIALNDLDGESITQYWWVFGGYLEDYDEDRNSEYTKTLFNTALEKGFIVINEEE